MRRLEAWFASANPRANVCGGQAALRAGADGCAMGRFAWVDADAQTVGNVRLDAAQRIGFVLAVQARWSSSYLLETWRFIRPGLPVTLMGKGEFWCRFLGGAYGGAPVYATLATGVPTLDPTDAQATGYRVVSSCGPGELAIITTWSTISDG